MAMTGVCCSGTFQSCPIIKHLAANTWLKSTAIPVNRRLWINTQSPWSACVSVSIAVGYQFSSTGVMIMCGMCLCSGHSVNSNRQHESQVPVFRSPETVCQEFHWLAARDCGHHRLRSESWVNRCSRGQRLFSLSLFVSLPFSAASALSLYAHFLSLTTCQPSTFREVF